MTASPTAQPAASRYVPGHALRFGLAYAMLFTVFGVCTPYLQVLLRARGFDRQEVGQIQGAFELMAVLAPPLWGALADRLDRPRLLLAIAALGAVPCFLLFGVVNTLLPALAVAVLFGLFFRPQIPLTDGYTFRYLHTQPGDYGPVRIGGSVSFVVLIVILESAGVAGEGAPRVLFAAFAIAGLLLALSVRLLPDCPPLPAAEKPREGDPRSGADWHVFLSRAFLCFLLAAFLGRLAMMSYYHFFTLFLKEELGFQQAGFIWILGPICEIPVIYFSGAIMRRIGVKRLFGLGLLGVTVRLLAYSQVDSVWQVLPLQILHALTFGAYHTASVSYIAKITPVRLKSSAQTLYAAITMGAGGIVGGWLGGYVAQHWGFATLYYTFGAIGFAGLLVLVFLVPEADTEQPT